MAQTIWAKLRNITLGSIHTLLDKVIDKNSASSVRQYIRDLEGAIEGLQGDAAVAQGSMKTESDKLMELNAKMEEVNKNIDLLLRVGDEASINAAVPYQVQLTGLEQQKDSLTKEVEGYKQTMEALDHTVTSLEAKRQEMVAQLRIIEQRGKSAEFKNKAADAIEAATRFTSISSIDNVADRAERQDDIADARLGRVTAGAEAGFGGDTALALARAKLLERQKQMGQDQEQK